MKCFSITQHLEFNNYMTNQFEISQVDGRHTAPGYFSHAISYPVYSHLTNAQRANIQLEFTKVRNWFWNIYGESTDSVLFANVYLSDGMTPDIPKWSWKVDSMKLTIYIHEPRYNRSDILSHFLLVHSG